jgi:hypothetical protein
MEKIKFKIVERLRDKFGDEYRSDIIDALEDKNI